MADAVRFLTFRSDRRLYALPADEVAEVIRMPVVAKVPQAPPSLLGVANLRGSVLPVASLAGLMGRELSAAGAASRAIVLQGEAPVALAVDGVEALVSVDQDAVETDQARFVAETGERLTGAFQPGQGRETARILDIRALLANAFVARPKARRAVGTAGVDDARSLSREDDAGKLVTFEVAGQEYALGLDLVQEITPAPDGLAVLPKSEALVLGVGEYRDGLLPLLSLRGLLGLPHAPFDGREKVVVTPVGGVLVGLVVDRMRDILPADARFLEPTPAVLAARMGGEAQVTAIYRGEGGRLVSILSPERLFREDVMQRLGKTGEAQPRQVGTNVRIADERRYLVFRLADEEYGVPIEAVDEVAPIPAKLTRLPKAPRFLEGVVNLRGDVLPVVDQRKRFDLPPSSTPEKRRLVVIRTERHRAGLIVDSVSEVLAADAAGLEPAPDLAGESKRLVEGVLNLESTGRMILVLDPSELLSRAERSLLDAFKAKQDGQAKR